MDIRLVTSDCNLADSLTRVPKRWFRSSDRSGLASNICGIGLSGSTLVDQITAIHDITGHQGVERTLHFVRRAHLTATRRDVQHIVNKCQVCQSIDPAAVNWKKGRLDVRDVWQRVGMDITHSGGKHYLTLIDCGPSRFAIWRHLRRQDSSSVIQQLESIFLERGAPLELLTDNDTAFTSQSFRQFAERWGTRICFRCAYVASGNGIAERCHRTVKRIAARKQCTVAEAVYWYNVSPKNDKTSSTAPANQLYSYKVRIRQIDVAPSDRTTVARNNSYEIGDKVWVRPPRNSCEKRYRIGTVTKVVSDQAVEVDNVPRHVRHLRSAIVSQDQCTDGNEKTMQYTSSSDDDLPLRGITVLTEETSESEESSDDSEEDIVEERPLPRRSSRERRPPDRYVPE
ncbi:Uncharacterised protein r2_g3930 [Pycnogonum litorale]